MSLLQFKYPLETFQGVNKQYVLQQPYFKYQLQLVCGGLQAEHKFVASFVQVTDTGVLYLS